MSESKEQATIGVAQALINKVQSTADGGFRVTLDLPETEIKTAQALMQKKTEMKLILVCFLEKSDG